MLVWQGRQQPVTKSPGSLDNIKDSDPLIGIKGSEFLIQEE